MASFEPRERRICIRIVYDGLGAAGKTTNLQQLASLFSAQRTSDLYSPATVDGRTLYFDWMQIHGGVVCGFPLLCQVISVPGQVVLTERRRHLLATADAVVYVSDSAKAEDAKGGFGLVAEATRANAEPPTIVVQANKQDQMASIDGPALRALFGLGDDVEVVEAIARDAIGVVDSFIAAVRGVTKRLQAQVEDKSARLALRVAERPDDLRDALDALEIDPEWAAEMLLEEAAASFASFEEREVAREVLAPPPAPVIDDGREHVPLPRPDTPAGFVWPAHTARARLEGLVDAGVVAAPIDEDGRVRVRVGDAALETSRADCFIEADHARQSIVRSARELTQLGGLLAPDTILALQISEEGQIWLWTVRPVLEPATGWLGKATSEEQRLARLELIASALADALAYTAQRGVELEPSLEHFGVDGGHLRYIGPRRAASTSSVSKMAEIALKSVAQTGAELGPFVAVLEQEVARRAIPVKLAPARTEWQAEARR